MDQLEIKKQTKGRSYIANYILVIAAVLFLLTYPLQDIWWCGLLSHLAGAAVIGGLADWYAVTALFKKPLGISFKTALIPNSKIRIAETARYMIENEILTVHNMYSVLKSHPVLDAVLGYLHSSKGFTAAEQVLGQIFNTFLYTVNIQAIVQSGAEMGQKTVENVNLGPIMGKAMKAALSGESGQNLIDFSILMLESMVKTDTAKKYLGEIYRESLRQYERRNFVYAMLVKAAMSSDIFSPENISVSLQEKFLEVLNDTKDRNSPYRKKIQQFLWKQAAQLQSNPSWQHKLEEYKMRFYNQVSSNPDLTEAWQRYIQNPARQRQLCNIAAKYLVGKLEAWKHSDMQVEQMNRIILAMAARELKRLQIWFGETAEKEIMQYDSNVLAAQLQDKVWNDLQMIRVNGSLVGALLGAAIYLGMYGLKGGW